MFRGKVHSQDFYRITIVFHHLHIRKLPLKFDYRMLTLNNTWDGFHLDLEKLNVILRNNEYVPKLIDKSVKKYLSKKIINIPGETKPSKTKKISDTSNCLSRGNFRNSLKINYKN